MKVIKFGGSSAANAEQIEKIVDIVAADAQRRIVVVSAPGRRYESDTKVTDLLIELAGIVLKGASHEASLRNVVERYAEIQRGLGLPSAVLASIEAQLRSLIKQRGSDVHRFLDALKASGEDSSSRLISEVFIRRGHRAKYVNPVKAGMLLLSDEFGNVEVLPESFEKLAALKEAAKSDILIFPGFFGGTRTGRIATFPRGGSDITGAILAAAIKARVYENFTDVDSVYAMDPRIVKNPPAIEEMTYREMRELAYAGFGIFHDEAIIPVVQAGIPIHIKNTNRPAAPGTKILPTRKFQHHEAIGISSAGGFCAINIEKYMMNREVGFIYRLLGILKEENILFEHMPSGIDNLSVIIRTSELRDREARIKERIAKELKVQVEIEHSLALLMVVGEGMHYSVGMAAIAAKALSDEGINIEMINQGASEISMMFAVKEKERERAVHALGRAFFSKSKPKLSIANGDRVNDREE